MRIEHSKDVSASWANNSGNSYSYTYTTINNHIADSFNQRHSHNGHGRGGCGVVMGLLLTAIPVIVSVVFCNILAGWLT